MSGQCYVGFSKGLLDNIKVEAYGEKVPFKSLAACTVREAQLLAVTAFDPGVSFEADGPIALPWHSQYPYPSSPVGFADCRFNRKGDHSSASGA